VRRFQIGVFFQDTLLLYCCTLIAKVAEPLLSRVT